MISPDINKLKELSKNYNLIPIFKEIRADFETPISLFIKLGGNILLESVEQGSNVGRYSIIGVGKKYEFIFYGKQITINKYELDRIEKTQKFERDNPLETIKEFLKNNKVAELEGLPPFYGGLIGYLGYEIIQYFEKIPIKEGYDYPDGILIIPEVIFVFDIIKRNVLGIMLIEVNDKLFEVYNQYSLRLNDLCDKIANSILRKDVLFPENKLKINYSTRKDEFIESIEKCKKYIIDGEIIQVVISHYMEIETKVDPFLLYRTLRILNPSPYMFYLDFDKFQIIGSSPEVMVRVQNKEMMLKPIAGTRKRGLNLEEDEKIEKDLISDPKEKAEHIMLVDLGRNDLGKVALPGSVKVTEYMAIEKYSHVMHIVSTIKAILDDKFDVFDVIKATFPAGTLTGAPKIRAMEIINEMEKHKRGPYGGMILNLGYNMNLDSCITIRTIVLKDNIARIQAGAGIVADSDPENEYQETINKASALIKAIEIAQKGGEL